MKPLSLTKPLIVASLFIGLGGCASTPSINLGQTLPLLSKPKAEPEVSILSKGHAFEAREPMQAFFSNRPALQRWAKEQGHIGLSLMSATGQIDFDQHHVAIVSPGAQPHAGYKLVLADDKMTYGDSSATITMRIDQPSADQIYAQALATPFVILKIPARPYQQIGFNYQACQLQQTAYLRKF